VSGKIAFESFIGWAGQKRYRCPECPFDSYDPAQVMSHYIGSHPESRGGEIFDQEEGEGNRIIVNPNVDLSRRSKKVRAPETLDGVSPEDL